MSQRRKRQNGKDELEVDEKKQKKQKNEKNDDKKGKDDNKKLKPLKLVKKNKTKNEEGDKEIKKSNNKKKDQDGTKKEEESKKIIKEDNKNDKKDDNKKEEGKNKNNDTKDDDKKIDVIVPPKAVLDSIYRIVSKGMTDEKDFNQLDEDQKDALEKTTLEKMQLIVSRIAAEKRENEIIRKLKESFKSFSHNTSDVDVTMEIEELLKHQDSIKVYSYNHNDVERDNPRNAAGGAGMLYSDLCLNFKVNDLVIVFRSEESVILASDGEDDDVANTEYKIRFFSIKDPTYKGVADDYGNSIFDKGIDVEGPVFNDNHISIDNDIILRLSGMDEIGTFELLMSCIINNSIEISQSYSFCNSLDLYGDFETLESSDPEMQKMKIAKGPFSYSHFKDDVHECFWGGGELDK
jgi:hypothetical protein